MTMNSLNLVPQLLQLPNESEDHHRTSRERLLALIGTDRAMYAAEQAAATSAGLWTVFDGANVDDDILRAYEMQYPNLAAERSLHEHWQDVMGRGDEPMTGFISGLKGKVAEFGAADHLRQAGWTNVEVAPNPTQSVFDITATPPEGGPAVHWQVKTGGTDYAQQVQDAVAESPDVHFAVSSEIYDSIAVSSTEMVDRLMDIGTDYELVSGIQGGLETLTDNLGIDIPDSLGSVLPYAGAIVAAAKLIHEVISTEREFREADRTTTNKIHMVRTLTLMARMGITTVLSTAGTVGGAAAGTAVPLVGNLVGGGVGAIGGGLIGMYLNQHFQPHMLRLGLDTCGLEEDDLFYFKSKSRVDQLAVSFHERANQLATV